MADRPRADEPYDLFPPIDPEPDPTPVDAHSKQRRQAAVIAVLAMSGFLFSASARVAQHEAPVTDLPGLIEERAIHVAELSDEVADLTTTVDALVGAQQTAPTGDAKATLIAQTAAGTTPVSGPGLRVELWDADPTIQRPVDVRPSDLLVHQQDVQNVMNALWAGGAEAMTLQGERVISTTTFRCVGNVLAINGKHFSPPYVIEAIGNVDRLLAALANDKNVQIYKQYVTAVGLGYSATKAEVVAPAVAEGSLSLSLARVPDGVEPFAYDEVVPPGGE